MNRIKNRKIRQKKQSRMSNDVLFLYFASTNRKIFIKRINIYYQLTEEIKVVFSLNYLVKKLFIINKRNKLKSKQQLNRLILFV